MKKKFVAGAILGVVAISIILAVVLNPDKPGGRGGGGEVGVVYIEGAITCGRGGGLFGEPRGSEEITATLRAAAQKPGLKAVVIRLNSPGGSAAAAQEISAEVERLKKSGKKVVVSMGDTAASAAYWIAASADSIVANPGTITGSIGVIMEYLDLQGLYDKIGVETETFKSGPHKDMGSPSRPATTVERAIFQSMIDDVYGQFIDHVAGGRGKGIDEIKPLADGRAFTGRQAKELGLVDQLGDFHDAVLLAGSLAGVTGEPLVDELGPRGFWQSMLAGNGSGAFQPSFLPLWPDREQSSSLNLR